MDLSSITLFILRNFLAYIFLTSGWNKSQHIHIFEREVADYELLPPFLVRSFSLILPFAEIGLGIMIVIGWEVKLAAVLISMLLMIFIAAMGINLVYGRKPNCGCFGVGHHKQIDLNLITYDFCLLILSLAVVVFGGGWLSFDNLPNALKESLFLDWILPLIILISCVPVAINLVKRLIRLLALNPI